MAEFFGLHGRVAFVTGAGRGIGAGIAGRLHAAGARIAVFDRDLDSARATASKVDGLALEGDVSSPEQVASAIEKAEGKLGALSILVNNAGITGRTDQSWKLDPDEVRQVFEVNFMGPFLFCKTLVPRLIERGYGRIVNVASIAGKEGNPTLLPYSASKAAVIALTKSLAKELAGKGDITVNAISPAVIKTAILDGVAPATVEYMISKIPLGRTGTIDEVAALVHYLVSSEASFTTGQCYDISGGRATY
jgi:NAD(P)-dependent dehydrogenase (short-subunit alcohol dehydrogenase family)